MSKTADILVIIIFVKLGGNDDPPESYYFWTSKQVDRYLDALKRHQVHHTLLFRSDKDDEH